MISFRSLILGMLGFFAVPTLAYAHVTVKPSMVGVGAYQTFTVSVPVEKDVSAVGVRLVIPEGVEHVTPNVKPGWKIDVIKNGDDVREISWTGTITPGFRDEFMFSAKMPAEEAKLAWKAYQRYQDGTVVAWDADPNETIHEDDAEELESKGPYSETKVVDDLDRQDIASLAIGISVLALLLASFAIYRSMRRA